MEIKKKNVDEIEVTSRLLNIILDMPVEQQIELLEKLDISGYDGSRKHVRTQLKNPWVVSVGPEKGKNSYECFIQNISRCGMFIETSKSFSIGQKITISFQVPASEKVFKIRGEIVRFQENGIAGVGVKFKRQIEEITKI